MAASALCAGLRCLLDEMPDRKALVDRALEFTERFIEPVAHGLDQALLTDPRLEIEDVLARGCEHGWLSLPIPTFLGGGGATILDCAILLEVLSAGCAGISNVFGAHYLGLSGILLGLDIHHFDRYFREVVRGEKRGVPVLFSAALTEPMAGTDVEDRDLLPLAKLVTAARRTADGYVLDGRKVFISNGTVARYHTVICAVDKDRPLETWSAFVVETGTPGFSIGRIEAKMGQRACHAAELVFEDCHVPLDCRIGLEGHGMHMTELVLAASRAPVGAIATGIAQGALSKTLAFAHRQAGGRAMLADKPWVQLGLAEMEAMVEAARATYVSAARYFDRHVTAALLDSPHVIGALMRASEPLRTSRLGRRVTAGETARRWSARRIEQRLEPGVREQSLGHSSLAKATCSDLAVSVCLKALEILGDRGAEERFGLEKYLRDARLTQIYEGTNQLNRLVGYKTLLRGALP